MTGKTRLTPYKEALSRKVQGLLKVLTTGKTKSIEWAHRCGARVCRWWHTGVAAARGNGQRGRAFLRRHPTGLKVIVGVTVFVLVGVALWKVPQFQVANLKLSDKERIELEDKTRGTLAQIFGGITVLGGLFVTARGVAAAWRTVQVNEEGQITERFTRAIDQLGSDKLEIRLGGIYVLERIARDSAKDHWPIMEVLTAYVREKAQQREEPAAEVPTTLNDMIERDQQDREIGGQENKPSADIQAILTVLGRRMRAYEMREDQRLDLRGVDIRGANLIEAHLERALFVRAHLEKADLINAHLAGANLRGAHLQDTRLQGADLTSVTGLTVDQILGTHRDYGTRLPAYIENELRGRGILET